MPRGRSLSLARAAAVMSLSLLACSSPDLESTLFTCTTDADCGPGQVCGNYEGELACQAAPPGDLRLGMSAPLQGPSEALGIEMRRGISAAFEQVNATGGVYGRRLTLEALNDNYDPQLALEMTRQLLDIERVVDDPDAPDVRGNDGVFALIGSVGTPTVLATAPIATKNRVVFFGPFTGAHDYLRDDTKSPYVYNYRAGYQDETAAMIEYIYRARIPRIIEDPALDYRRILVFAQNDSFGDAGYGGVVAAYNERVAPLPSATAIQRIGYERDDVSSVDPALLETQGFFTELLAESSAAVEPVAVIMIDTYLPANRFIRGLRDWINADAARATRLSVSFLNVSFVGGDALAEALTTTPESYPDVLVPGGSRSYAEDVIVTQVVPNYDSAARAVAEYRDAIRSFDAGSFSFTSLEGYVVARLFTRALELNGPTLTTESFVRTLDTRATNIDLGLGTPLGFSTTDHQACDTVWGSQIQDDGSFSVPFVWNRDAGIEVNR